MTDTVIWAIGWVVACDLCDYLTVKTELLQGKAPRGISEVSKGTASFVWFVGIILTMIF